MSSYRIQDYLKCYHQLSQPQLSKNANQNLLDIQGSFEAWEIALQLISNNNVELVLHGTQLLSKKLNTPPSSLINLDRYLEYLYLLPQKTPLVWLCIAKIIVHLIREQPIIPQNYTKQQKLRYLKEIPAAIAHIRSRKFVDDLTLKERFMELAIPIISAQFRTNTELVIQTLDSFVSYGTKIRNQQVVQTLLTLPFQVGGHILEEILSREQYPKLQNQILFYLGQQKESPEIFDIYVVFFKTVDYSQLSMEQLVSGLKLILNCLYNEKEQPKNKLSESYELWLEMAKQYRQNQLNAQAKQAIRDALLTVWKITCKEAVLNQLPQKVQQIDPLDLGGDDEEERADIYYQVNKDIENYRQYAGDFFLLSYQTLSLQSQAFGILISMVQQLASGSLLHLELSIRIIFSLAPAQNGLLVHTAPVIARIFARSSQMNEYVCRQVIRMIGQLSEIFTQAPNLLSPALQFLSNTFFYPSLGTMASTSCCTLLEQVDLQKANGLVQMMQAFMQHIYEAIFKPDCDEKVIELLSKSMAIFVYKVKRSPEDYAGYLSAFAARIMVQTKENQSKFVDAAISGQLWINCHQQLKKSEQERNQSKFNRFMPPFSAFLEGLVKLFLQLLNVNDKKVFFKRLLLINSALRTNCIGTGQTWVQLCNYLFQKYLKGLAPTEITKIISSMMNLTRSAVQLNIKNVASVVASGLRNWHNYITSLLSLKAKQIDLVLSSSIVYFHLRIVQLVKIFPECVNVIGYSPDPIVNYIIWSILNSEVWEYQFFKYSLQYLLIVLQLGYAPQSILLCLFKKCLMLQPLWTSMDPIFSFVFRKYGFEMYEKLFTQMNQVLGDRSNPLNRILREAFQNGDGKTIKNLLTTI